MSSPKNRLPMVFNPGSLPQYTRHEGVRHGQLMHFFSHAAVERTKCCSTLLSTWKLQTVYGKQTTLYASVVGVSGKPTGKGLW